MSNKQYKSSVFSMLLEIPKYALDVYNSLNNSNYEDQSLLEIDVLDNSGVLLSIRNDSSFLLDNYLNMYEHQSTYNPNMPLRFLLYVSSWIKEFVKKNQFDLYGSKRISIPTPRFVVIYNGLEQRPEKEIIKLSDAYIHKDECYDLDLSCIAFNINPGYNNSIKQKSNVLYGYTIFVEKVRKYRQSLELKIAIEQAIDDCIKEDVLSDFFTENRWEVLNMAILDFTFEQREKLIRRDSFQEGKDAGRLEGKLESQRSTATKLKQRNYPISEIAEITGLTVEEIINL